MSKHVNTQKTRWISLLSPPWDEDWIPEAEMLSRWQASWKRGTSKVSRGNAVAQVDRKLARRRLNWQQPERDLPNGPFKKRAFDKTTGRASQRIFPPCWKYFRERMLEANLSPKPSRRAEIADAYTLIVECDRALAGRSCRKESALLSSSPNQLLSPCITCESSTIYLVSRTALRMCVLQGLHRSFIKSERSWVHHILGWPLVSDR